MTENYDGFYFLPGKGDDEMALSFFEFGEELGNQKKVDSKNEVGDLWHIAFFTKDENDNPEVKRWGEKKVFDFLKSEFNLKIIFYYLPV